jgi:hypothetical protein
MTHLVWKFALRRVMEVGGILGTVVAFLFGLWGIIPPPAQDLIVRIATREWADITLGQLWIALPPAAIAIWGYVWSAKSTFKPQVVVDGEQVPMKDIAAAKKTIVVESARTAVDKKAATKKRQPNLLERLFGKRS